MDKDNITTGCYVKKNDMTLLLKSFLESEDLLEEINVKTNNETLSYEQWKDVLIFDYYLPGLIVNIYEQESIEGPVGEISILTERVDEFIEKDIKTISIYINEETFSIDLLNINKTKNNKNFYYIYGEKPTLMVMTINYLLKELFH